MGKKILSLFLILALVGCGGNKTDTGSQKTEATDPPSGSAPSVHTITLPELQRMIRDRNGKQLVLNMWASWCVPCREEFPDLVKLVKKYGDTTELVGVSLDYPDEIESQVIPFLRQNPVNFPIYVAEVASQDEFINSLNPDWSGALPTTFIYDSNGQQISMMIGKRSLPDFEAALPQRSRAGSSE